MSKNLRSIVFASSGLLLAFGLGTGCGSSNPTATTSGAKNAKAQAAATVKGTATSTEASASGGPDGPSGPGVTPPRRDLPMGSGAGVPGADGSALPTQGANVSPDADRAPGTGEETAGNVNLLESARGSNQLAPTPTTELNLDGASAKSQLQGNWTSALSREQELLLHALTLGLAGDEDAVKNSQLEGPSKDLALDLAIRITRDSSQEQASPTVAEAQKLKQELEDPEQRQMTINGDMIAYTGIRGHSDEEGPVSAADNVETWNAQFTVSATDGNQVTIKAVRTGDASSEDKTILFVNKDQIWVPKGEGEGTVYNRSN